MGWLRRWILRVLGVEQLLSEAGIDIAEFRREREEMAVLCQQLSDDSMINNKAEGLLRGLVRDVDPVIKKNKVLKDEMRKKCGELDVRVKKLEGTVYGKE